VETRDFTGIYRKPQEFTGIHRNLQEIAGNHRKLLERTEFHARLKLAGDRVKLGEMIEVALRKLEVPKTDVNQAETDALDIC